MFKAGRRRSSPAFGSLKNKAETLLRKIQLRVSEGLDHQTIIKLYNILTKWNILPSHGDESVAALKQALKQLSRTIDACEKQTDLTTIHSCLEEAVKNCHQERMLSSLAESEETGDAGEDSKSGELSHPKSAPALGESNKEYIRVYINSDTAFRSFVVSSEETTREFLQRIAPKLALSDDFNEGCELFLVNTKTQSEELIAMDDKPAKLKRSISASGSGKFMLKSKVKTEGPKSSTTTRSSKTIESPASSPQLNRPKMEGIKVYLSDGTFKSVFISGNETVGQITSKILSKLSQQLDIDTSKYWLFEATKGSRESEHRRLDDSEPISQVLHWAPDVRLMAHEDVAANQLKRQASFLDDRSFSQSETDLEYSPQSSASLLRSASSSSLSFSESSPPLAGSPLEFTGPKLQLSRMGLETLPTRVMTEGTHVKTMHIGFNQLASLDDLKDMTQLVTLKAAQNRISSVPSFIGTMSNLEVLDLTGNQISALPKEFYSLNKLKRLHLSYNRLSVIDAELSALHNLEELTLACNEIHSLPNEVFKHMSKLILLDLSQNNLTQLPSSIQSLVHLEELYISCNQLINLPTEVYQLKSLRSLDVSNNAIEVLPEGLLNLVKLQELIAQGNPIKQAPNHEIQLLSVGDLKRILVPGCDELQVPERSLGRRFTRSNVSVMDLLQIVPQELRTSADSDLGKTSSVPVLRSNSTLGNELIVTNKEELIKLECEVLSKQIEASAETGAKYLLDDHHNDDYYTYFHGQLHTNYVGAELIHGIIVISILTDTEQLQGEEVHRVLIKTRERDLSLLLPKKSVKTSSSKSKTNKQHAVLKAAVNYLRDTHGMNISSIKEISDSSFSEELLDLEERLNTTAFKFGVLYCAQNQRTESEYYNNVNGSKDFDEFLDMLGEKVQLKGWTKYNGGLDVESNRSGDRSLYAEWSNFEIMFHVSTMLPHLPDEEQQLERKRHIGNDVIVLVFQDEDSAPLQPEMIRSYFNHVFIVVRPVTIDGKKYYRTATAWKDGVTPFGPSVSPNHLFSTGDEFRTYLLTKMINGERAAYTAPGFAKAMTRTREQMLLELSQKFMPSKPRHRKSIALRLRDGINASGSRRSSREVFDKL